MLQPTSNTNRLYLTKQTRNLGQIHFSNTTGAPNEFWPPSTVSASDDKPPAVWLMLISPIVFKAIATQKWNSGCGWDIVLTCYGWNTGNNSCPTCEKGAYPDSSTKTTNLLLWFCVTQGNRVTVIALNGAQLFHCWLDWPPHWGPHSLQFPSAAKQSGQCSLIHWLQCNLKGFCGRRMCVCIRLSLSFPVLQSPSSRNTTSLFRPSAGPSSFLSSPHPAPFQKLSHSNCLSISNSLPLTKQ